MYIEKFMLANKRKKEKKLECLLFDMRDVKIAYYLNSLRVTSKEFFVPPFIPF